jgi:hypothetical protein
MRMRLAVVGLCAAGLVGGCAVEGRSQPAPDVLAEQDVALEDMAELEDLRAADELAQEDLEALYDDGYDDGLRDGIEAGGAAGREEGYARAEGGEERELYPQGTYSPYDATYAPALEDESYIEGYEEGYAAAFAEGFEVGYEYGYNEALAYYRDYQVENPYDRDCSDYGGGGGIVVSEDDPNNLDYDGDGIGCD